MIPGTTYCQTGIRLGAGDTLLLYTDGITEARNAVGDQLGQKGLLDAVRAVRTGSPSETCRDLLSTVENFRGGERHHDGETVLVLQYVG